jgi:phytoene dehydrogenase-like protein
MSTPKRVAIVGGGPNGLVTAFYLARAGLKPLVLERRPLAGGIAVTEEFYPGFKAPTLAHTVGPLRPDVARDMQLEKHGLRLLSPEVRLCVLDENGPPLLLYEDSLQTAAELAGRSSRDSQKYIEFHDPLRRMGEVFAGLGRMTPPSMEKPSAQDLFRLLQTGRMARGMGKQDLYRLLRWTPMPIADLVEEWFESEVLRAAIAARGIFGAALGPRSAGSTLLLLARSADDAHPAGQAYAYAGGVGALTQAMAAAAQAAGAEIRTEAEVVRIEVNRDGVTAVHLANGQELAATAVISSADPKRTLLGMIDPMYLSPEFLGRLQNYRCSGVVAKVNLALDDLPDFDALKDAGERALAGRIQIGSSINYLERAFDACKYGEFSRDPFLEVRIPTLLDPSLAPAGKHVMSVQMQFAPYHPREGNWSAGQSEALGDVVVQALSRYAPKLPSRVLHRQVLSPKEIEDKFALTGGHTLQGELTLDQFFTTRPLLGWARYRTPIAGLYLCGSGTHPGWGVTGASGANAAREVLKDIH